MPLKLGEDCRTFAKVRLQLLGAGEPRYSAENVNQLQNTQQQQRHQTEIRGKKCGFVKTVSWNMNHFWMGQVSLCRALPARFAEYSAYFYERHTYPPETEIQNQNPFSEIKWGGNEQSTLVENNAM